MASPSDTEALILKLRELPPELVAKVDEYVDSLRGEGRKAAVQARLQKAIDAGHLSGPKRERCLSDDALPVEVPGTPGSEIVRQDRR